MKKHRFSENQIIKALKEHESGRDVMDICLVGHAGNWGSINPPYTIGGRDMAAWKLTLGVR